MEYQPYQPTQEEIDNPPFDYWIAIKKLFGIFVLIMITYTICDKSGILDMKYGDVVTKGLTWPIPTVIMWLFGEWRHPQKPLVDLFASYPSDYDYTVEDFD